MADVEPHTVVWLNEAQHYLLPPDARLGERVAAGLRTLLTDPARDTVLVLATMWRQYWTIATTPPQSGQPDSYSQARQLLTDTDIAVPDTFTSADLQAPQIAAAADPRLRHASDNAPQGRITQHLAGVPELLARYRNPETPATRAIIQVAIDARRLGHPPAIPHTLLEQAAPGYLDDHQWEQAGDDWLERALAFTARPCHGAATASPTRPATSDRPGCTADGVPGGAAPPTGGEAAERSSTPPCERPHQQAGRTTSPATSVVTPTWHPSGPAPAGIPPCAVGTGDLAAGLHDRHTPTARIMLINIFKSCAVKRTRATGSRRALPEAPIGVASATAVLVDEGVGPQCGCAAPYGDAGGSDPQLRYGAGDLPQEPHRGRGHEVHGGQVHIDGGFGGCTGCEPATRPSPEHALRETVQHWKDLHNQIRAERVRETGM